MIPALLGVIGPIIGKIIESIPNAAEREKARLELEVKLRESETELLKALQVSDVSQAEINKIEASNSSMFVSGWRPACGWLCVGGMAWAFVFQPILNWIALVNKWTLTVPDIQSGELTSLLFGLLGMAGIRSFEKIKGVASK